MTIRTFVKEKVSDLRAWNRGEVRVAPSGTRGRVYARKSGEPAVPGDSRVGAKATAHLSMVIIRADGTREVLEQIEAHVQDYPNG